MSHSVTVVSEAPAAKQTFANKNKTARAIQDGRTEEPGLVLGVEHQAAQVVEVACAVRSSGAQLFVAEQLLGVEQLDVAVVAAHRQDVRLLPVDL